MDGNLPRTIPTAANSATSACTAQRKRQSPNRPGRIPTGMSCPLPSRRGRQEVPSPRCSSLGFLMSCSNSRQVLLQAARRREASPRRLPSCWPTSYPTSTWGRPRWSARAGVAATHRPSMRGPRTSCPSHGCVGFFVRGGTRDLGIGSAGLGLELPPICQNPDMNAYCACR